MTLYEVGSDDEIVRLFKNANEHFSTNGGTLIWINGKLSISKNGWYTYPQDEIFYLTERVSIPQKFKLFHGRCLIVMSFTENRYQIGNYGCNFKNYFYCKIKNLEK